MTNKSSYWYILHIPTGESLKYRDKEFNKKEFDKAISAHKRRKEYFQKLKENNLYQEGINLRIFHSAINYSEYNKQYAARLILNNRYVSNIYDIEFSNLIDTRRNSSELKFKTQDAAVSFLKEHKDNLKSFRYNFCEFMVISSEKDTNE